MLLEKANLISVAEAARIIGVTTGRVRQLIDDGRLTAEPLGKRSLVVERNSVIRYAKSPRLPGPKAAE